MYKVLLPHDTWAYYNFISDAEQKNLLEWAFKNFNKTNPNSKGPHRFFADKIQDYDDLPAEYLLIKQRIIDVDDINPYIIDPTFGDFLSFNYEGGSIHRHTDPNQVGCIHTRYNLLLSVPESGGDPIYNYDSLYGSGTKIPYKEKFIWRCEAGKYNHESLPVIGQKPRINISFGFSIKI